ncbi:glycosyltransferase [Schlesneria paludicola]|uniref:glycosyltransferase n=1 Tax=Schlesneria paludicola TaxID=360056 RepID=UPI00029A9FF1|nr:glycosyltransferase [Schlesneria paludicola]
MVQILIVFRHGLGDCVQFTVVVQHLLKWHPDWMIDLQFVDAGKGSLFQGFERVRVIARDEDRKPHYDEQYVLDWWEADSVESDAVPATKAEQCLRRIFGIEPEPDLCGYSFPGKSNTSKQVEEYLQGIAGGRLEGGRFPVVVLHYQGNSSPDQKNLTHDVAARLCAKVVALGYVPVILDWDHRSPLPDDASIHCPTSRHPIWQGLGTGDAATIAQLIEASTLFIGIDSGPQKVAATTTTPMICVWRQMHPVHYFPFRRRQGAASEELVATRHLIPSSHLQHLRGDHERGLRLLARYDFTTYDASTLSSQLIDEVASRLPARLQRSKREDSISADDLRKVVPERRWLYRRVGLDERWMTLTSNPLGGNFRIEEGQADRERVWNVEETATTALLTVWGDHGGPTFHAVWRGEKFVGRWLSDERCEVELIPDQPLDILNPTTRCTERRDLEPFFVGIPTYNCYDLCANLIDSVFRNTALPQVVYVIDNGDGPARFHYDHPQVSIFRPQRNLGVSRSWNLLHRFAAPYPIVILNDDIELGRNCLERLVTCDGLAVTIDGSHAYEAFMMREEVWQTIGDFDEAFFPAYFEDNDHARRLELAGIEIVCPTNDGVVSCGRSNTKSRLTPDATQALHGFVAKNRDYYLTKWGGLPHQEQFLKPFDSNNHVQQSLHLRD